MRHSDKKRPEISQTTTEIARPPETFGRNKTPISRIVTLTLFVGLPTVTFSLGSGQGRAVISSLTLRNPALVSRAHRPLVRLVGFHICLAASALIRGPSSPCTGAVRIVKNYIFCYTSWRQRRYTVGTAYPQCRVVARGCAVRFQSEARMEQWPTS
jgi:hypothetical protein